MVYFKNYPLDVYLRAGVMELFFKKKWHLPTQHDISVRLKYDLRVSNFIAYKRPQQ